MATRNPFGRGGGEGDENFDAPLARFDRPATAQGVFRLERRGRRGFAVVSAKPLHLRAALVERHVLKEVVGADAGDSVVVPVIVEAGDRCLCLEQHGRGGQGTRD